MELIERTDSRRGGATAALWMFTGVYRAKFGRVAARPAGRDPSVIVICIQEQRHFIPSSPPLSQQMPPESRASISAARRTQLETLCWLLIRCGALGRS